jgi:hypothetical protein
MSISPTSNGMVCPTIMDLINVTQNNNPRGPSLVFVVQLNKELDYGNLQMTLFRVFIALSLIRIFPKNLSIG